MSVQNQIVKNVYEGNGSTTVFPYTFALNETDGEHVKVYIADETELSTPTDNFTIDTQLRTVTYPRTGAALPEGSKIVIRRELPNEQDTNLENNGAFFAETIEREFDREVMMIQQLAEQVNRAVKTDMSSVTTPDELIAELRAKAQAAVESASAALVSENNARASEQAAAQSETLSESYKDTTYGYMTTAETSATTATNKATEASASASAAAQSKTGAEAAADTAYDYMIEAGASESIATQSATNAANSATAAATSEANARTLVNTVNPPWNIRMASTEYSVGDIAYSALLPSWARLEAVNNGTTGTGELPITGITLQAGQYITDGTVKWIIDDIRDGDRVGDVVFHSVLLPCHILADGAILADVSMDYPRLLATVIAENMVTSDSIDMGKYYYDSEADTLRVPKADDGRFIEGSTTAGTAHAAGLPNITGSMPNVALNATWIPTATGVVRFTQTNTHGVSGDTLYSGDFDFDASRLSSVYGNSDTVQPKSLTSIAQIKY